MPTDGSTSPTFEYTVTSTSPQCISSSNIATNGQGSIVCKPTIVSKGWCLLSMLQHPVTKLLETSRTTLWERALQLLWPLLRPQLPLPSIPLHQILWRQEPTLAQMDNANASAISTSTMVLQILFKVLVSSVAQSAVLNVCVRCQCFLIYSPLGN
jgi:hypothetical protein